jgi:RNA polymerase sigma-70 factor (ECF subfamily)
VFAVADVEKVIRHLVRFGSSQPDAEDLAQEALMIAWRKRDDLDPERSRDAWLYGIARNVYRNHARTVARRRTDAVGDPDAVDDTGSVVDALAVHRAVQQLPENQQDIVILHELEGYTLKETAELLEVPFDTAKDRLRRAREQLRGGIGDVAAERAHTNRVAKAAAATVLVGYLAALSRTASAAGAAAVGGAVAVKSAWWASRWVLPAALATGAIVGVAVDRAVVDRTPLGSAADPVATRAPEVAADASTAPAEPAPDASIASGRGEASPPDAAVAPSRRDSASATVAIARPDPVAKPDPIDPAGANPEAQLIERARVAVQRGNYNDALVALMSHERRFATGQLAEERDVLAIEAYAGAGNTRLARERIAQYRRDHPAGLHAARVTDVERRLGP